MVTLNDLIFSGSGQNNKCKSVVHKKPNGREIVLNAVLFAKSLLFSFGHGSSNRNVVYPGVIYQHYQHHQQYQSAY